MNQLGTDGVMNLIKQLEPIRDQAAQSKDSIVALYSSVDPRKDARITAFSKMVNVFNSVQLALTFVSKHLLDLNWWKVISKGEIPVADARIYANEFMGFSKLGFVQFLFSTTESSLRLFLRALDPTACDGGMGHFKSVYDCLLRSHLSRCPSESVELLDLLRLVRNTIHNNGVYFHRNGRDVTVTWNGTSYEFKQSTPVDFVTWQFLLEVSDAISSLMYTIVTDANLRAITNEITDPFAP
jgi:hypothetical protein